MTTTNGDDGGSPLGTYLNILRWPGLDPKLAISTGAAKVWDPVRSNEERAKKASAIPRGAMANRMFISASVLQKSLEPGVGPDRMNDLDRCVLIRPLSGGDVPVSA